MNLRTTLVLLVLAAAGAVVLVVGLTLPPALDPVPRRAAAPDAGTRDALAALDPAKFTRIEVRRDGRSTTLERRPDGTWSLPGNWPTRQPEVQALVQQLGQLASRFDPEPIQGDPGLSNILVVELSQGADKHTLTFGEKKADAGENRFIRPTYLRLDSRPEIVRLGPGLIAALDRPTDYYQQRRLFPGMRVAKDDNAQEKVERLDARRLMVDEAKPVPLHYTLQRVGDQWVLQTPRHGPDRVSDSVLALGGGAGVASLANGALWLTPQGLHVRSFLAVGGPTAPVSGMVLTLGGDAGLASLATTALWATPQGQRARCVLAERLRDRLDPRARDTLLEAVPDVWAEQFLPTDPALVSDSFLTLAGDSGMASLATGALWVTRQGLLARSGLDTPTRTLTVTPPGGAPVVLLIGNLSVPRGRSVPQPTPPGLPPGLQMPPRMERVDYRYARLQGNDQVFEIKADRLKDVFVARDTLRDAQVVRFQPADARRVEVRHGTTDIVLERDAGRWKLRKPVRADADDSKVNELLDKLSQVQARGADVIDQASPVYGLGDPAAVVTVTVEEEDKKAEARGSKKEKPKKTRTLTVLVGKEDKLTHKLYVRAGGWPRVNAVDAALAPLVARPVLAYRGKRVLDFLAADLDRITIDNQGKTLTLVQTADGWRVTRPVTFEADSVKTGDLANSLGALEVLEFVDDTPKTDDLATKYGLAKPSLQVTLRFKDKARRPRTLEIGKARGGKPGYFARVAGAPAVFAIPDTIHTDLARGALAYRPLQLWQTQADAITAVEVRRQGHPAYELKRAGKSWEVTGPFTAPAEPVAAQGLIDQLAAPQCVSYKANEAKDLSVYGLDKPAATLNVMARGGKSHTLLLGKTAEGGRYAKLGDQSAVFVLGDPLVKALDRGALDRLFTGLLFLDPSRISTIRIKADSAALKLERQGDGWRVLDAPGAPFPADAHVASALTGAWLSLKAERFTAYGPKVDLGKYGLDKPAYVVTVVLGRDGGKSEEHTVELGNTVKGEKNARYARVDRGPGVVVLGPATTAALAHTALDFVDRTVLKLDPMAVTLLQRHMGDKVLEMARKDGDWQLVKPTEEKADDRSVQDLVGQLADLRAARIAAYPVKDLAEFGLDRPAALVTIKLASGKPAEHILKLGKVADPVTEDRYALADGSKAVAVLPGTVARRLVAAPLAFRDRSLLRFADADKARLERGPRQAVFAKVEGTWKLIEPLRGDAENDELEEFVNALAKLRADELVVEKPTAAQLKTYGLDRPELRWRLQSGDKEVLDLLVGNPDKDGKRRYARLAGRDLVFLLDPRLTARVVAEYRPRAVWTTPLDAVSVESLRFVYPRNPFTLDKAGSNWQVEGKPDVKVDTAAVNDTLAALAGLKLERYAVDKDADRKLFGLEPPQLVLEVATRAGKRVLQVGGPVGETKARYARLPSPDRPGIFVLDEATCARLFRNLAAFTTPAPAPRPMP